MDQHAEVPDIVFEEQGFQRSPRSLQARTPKIVEWTVAYSGGCIKNERQANYVLIGFVVVAIVVSLVLFFGRSFGSPEAIQYREDMSPEARAKLPPGVWESIPSKFQ